MSEGRREDGTFDVGNRANRDGLNVSPFQRAMKAKLKALSPDAIDFVQALIRGKIEGAEVSDRFKAAQLVINKTVPNPKQSLKVSGQLKNVMGELSTEDVQALIRATKGEGK